jgi:hypothetical protein
MPRIRTIKPEFWGDEKLAPMEPIDRLVFLGLISMADDAGRVLDSVRSIDGFIFPETEDSAKDSLTRLAELGRIERGVTLSGQRVIQIVNWSHQKIDKPNFSSALPEIAVADESLKARRRVPPKLRDAIFDRDKGVCQACGRVVRRDKRDRYDSDPDLAEIDHIHPVVEGGTNEPQNLQLLCLGCNRTKAGEAVRRRNAANSEIPPRHVGDASAPHINDLRPVPTTNDQGPTTVDRAESDARRALKARLKADMDRVALDVLLDAVPNEATWCAEMTASLDGLGGHIPLTPEQLGVAIRDYVANGDAKSPTMRHFRGYLRRSADQERGERAPNEQHEPNDRPSTSEIVTRIRDMAKTNGHRSYIPIAEVDALGKRIGAAYRAVGGADRFLSVAPDKLPFLIRDFGQALKDAGRKSA